MPMSRQAKCRAKRRLHRHPSLEKFSCLQKSWISLTWLPATLKNRNLDQKGRGCNPQPPSRSAPGIVFFANVLPYCMCKAFVIADMVLCSLWMFTCSVTRQLAGFSPEFLQLAVHALCIINDLWGLVDNGCGQLHACELQVVMQRSKAKQKLVKGQQLTLFGERASSDHTDNLSKSWQHLLWIL